MVWSITLLLPVICYFSFFLFSLHLYYLFFTATYCQFISIYYLIDHYLLICSLITLKMYLVYTTISIFYCCWSNYVSPQFVLHWKKMTSFNYGAKGVRDVDPAFRCHQSNIMPDSIFSFNIAQWVTCLFVFSFALFYVCIKGWYSRLLLFVETGYSVLSLLH